MFKQVALAIASLAISSSHAVDVDYGFNNNVLACKGDSVNVNWKGFHNIHETLGSGCDSGDISEIEGYLENGTEKTYSNDELSAAPGERRYFKCSAHCGVQASRFEVYCPPVEVDYGFNNNVLACKGDSVKVNWKGFHNIHETIESGCDSGDISEIEGYLENGSGKTYSNDELSAAPGERRYFKCSAHCGVQASRFEVYCPPVEVDYGFNNNVLACKGDSVKVNWKGFHNIHETIESGCDSGDISEIEGYLENGSGKTYSNDELSAAPGERRYFKCSAHCGVQASRFEVYCPSVEVDYGFNNNVLACKGDSVKVNWKGYHNIYETVESGCDSKDIGEVEAYWQGGTEKTYSNDELSAAPGERRYFKCSAHCGEEASRFETYCPVEVDYGFNNNVLACKGTSVKVNWKGFHNIHETLGSGCDSGDLGEIETYLSSGHEHTYSNDELSAAPGERRYFKCSAHCGEKANRIETYCPAVDVCSGLNRRKCKKVKDSCSFGAKKIFAGCKEKRKKYAYDCAQHDGSQDLCAEDNYHKGLCKFATTGVCSHVCEHLGNKDCKNRKNPYDNKKMCKTIKEKNPCKGCKPKGSCSNQ